MSTIFSPPFLNENYTPAFTSFGKDFYYKRMSHPLPSLLLSRIVELHDGGETDEPNSFILRSLTHIPFIRQPVGKDSLGCACLNHVNAAETITTHKTAILRGYSDIVRNVPTIAVSNDHATDSLKEVVTKIREVIR